jgi:hypothetical protein
MNIEESARMIVRLALGTAAIDGGSPSVILIDEIKKYSHEAANEAVELGLISELQRASFISAAKGEIYKEAFVAWDEIVTGDGWKRVTLPWSRWGDEIETTTKAVTERVALDLAGDLSRRRAMRAGRHLTLAVQRRASELIDGWPIPRAGRTAIIDALCDIAVATFDRRLSELSLSGNQAGGRA